MKYIILAKPYYQWAAQNLSATHADNSADADARWMAEFYEIVSQRKGVARIRSESGIEKRVPINCLVKYPA